MITLDALLAAFRRQTNALEQDLLEAIQQCEKNALAHMYADRRAEGLALKLADREAHITHMQTIGTEQVETIRELRARLRRLEVEP